MLVRKEIYFVCRTCLEIGTNYFNLFNYFEDGIALSDMLIECVATQALEHDGLPSHICSECKTKLYSCWTFKSLALEAESKLRSNTKSMKRNEEPQTESDIIKVETAVTNNDYNVDGKKQVRCSDPFTFRNYSVNDDFPTNNIKDNACDNDIPNAYEEKNVSEHLGEFQYKNEITVVNDSIKPYENDLIECANNSDSLEKRSQNLEPTIDNKMLSDMEEETDPIQYFENTDIKDETRPNVRKLHDILPHKAVRNKRKPKKELDHNPQNIRHKKYNKSFMTKAQQIQKSDDHMNIFTCSSCNRAFVSRKSLKMHTSRSGHIYEDKYICQICEIEFDTFDKLKSHKETHVNEPHECNVCKKVFMSRPSLKAHIERHIQTPESKPICELCGKVYSNIYTLRTHYETHKTEKTVPCPTCGKLFTNQNNMTAHLKFHTARECYICEYCNKGFKSADRKKKHVLIHTGEKPYSCKVCDKRFTHTGTLHHHMLTHTGEAKFVCDKCPYKCRYKQQFDNHLKKHK